MNKNVYTHYIVYKAKQFFPSMKMTNGAGSETLHWAFIQTRKEVITLEGARQNKS